jgi:hypothetical protein
MTMSRKKASNALTSSHPDDTPLGGVPNHVENQMAHSSGY